MKKPWKEKVMRKTQWELRDGMDSIGKSWLSSTERPGPMENREAGAVSANSSDHWRLGADVVFAERLPAKKAGSLDGKPVSCGKV